MEMKNLLLLCCIGLLIFCRLEALDNDFHEGDDVRFIEVQQFLQLAKREAEHNIADPLNITEGSGEMLIVDDSSENSVSAHSFNTTRSEGRSILSPNTTLFTSESLSTKPLEPTPGGNLISFGSSLEPDSSHWATDNLSNQADNSTSVATENLENVTFSSTESSISWQNSTSLSTGIQNSTYVSLANFTDLITTLLTESSTLTMTTEDYCAAVTCGNYQRCLVETSRSRCECQPGFVRPVNSYYSAASGWENCTCPASKIFQNDSCIEANKIFQVTMEIQGDFSSNLEDLSNTLAKELAQNIEQQVAVELQSHFRNSTFVNISVNGFTPVSNRKRAVSNQKISAALLIKFRAADLSSIPRDTVLASAIQQLTPRNISLASSGGTFEIPVQKNPIVQTYDYCSKGDHNCDSFTTICTFDDKDAKIICHCHRFHSRISDVRCVYNSSLAENFISNFRRTENQHLWITIYVFIGLFVFLLFCLFITIVLLQTRACQKPTRIQSGKTTFSEKPILEYKNYLPRAKLNETIVLDADDCPPNTSTDIHRTFQPTAGVLPTPNRESSSTVTTFVRRNPASRSSTPNKLSHISIRDSYGLEMANYDFPSPPPTSAVSHGPDGKPINAFDGPRYRSAEGIVFSMDDQLAVNEAIRQHRHSALINAISQQQQQSAA